MAKVAYTKLQLAKDSKVNTLNYNGVDIEVKEYLPIKDKIDLVTITLQESLEEETYYNPIKMEMYFNLNIIFLYTNINFTEKQKEDLFSLYDTLEKNGIIDQVIDTIPEKEYNVLVDSLDELKEEISNFNLTFMGIMTQVSKTLNTSTEQIKNISQNFDLENLKTLSTVFDKLK